MYCLNTLLCLWPSFLLMRHTEKQLKTAGVVIMKMVPRLEDEREMSDVLE